MIGTILEQYWNTQPWSQCSLSYSSLASHPRLLEWQNLSPPYLREKKHLQTACAHLSSCFNCFNETCVCPHKTSQLTFGSPQREFQWLSCGLLHIKRAQWKRFRKLNGSSPQGWIQTKTKPKQIQGEFTVKPGTSLTDFWDTWHVCCIVFRLTWVVQRLSKTTWNMSCFKMFEDIEI